MSEIERETPLFTRKKTSLSGILKEAAAKAKPFAAEHRVKIILRLPKKRLYIKAVASQLESAVYHLLINGINFSHVGGRIICSLEETKTQIQIKIRDYGQGIPSREIPRIFTKFYQIEGYMTRTVDGLGLGLPLVKQIVSNHGGTITVKSTLGKGSLFTMKFPKVQTETDILEEQVILLRKRLSAGNKQSIAFAVDLKELLKKRK
ncbi:ATP-binding protein [candidate division KSB1 bacterium]|nr:ATP-binding protein [candidate division KSB1 bacterium]